ncbi:MAG: TonB-dependent receptor [Flavobacteriaceae bacterium]|nr:TonB-dependent receptor [Flavobacteriaceae bacterium]MCY4161489.1 TonB-dependent receptor [Flavobacteriaceae bacterium]MCY4267041.1 TonB-dependent receptor [Flavobacteriaceae bacterium]
MNKLRHQLILFVFILGPLILYSQQQDKITVSGIVTSSEDGLPLSGVNIFESGVTNGVVSNFDGEYQITVSTDSQLVISYIGFESQTIAVNGQDTINIILDVQVGTLQDVVVVGYGTQRKSDVTGAVSSISSDQLSANPVTSLDQALQGKLSGISIINDSGDPGGGVSVRIRGQGTIGNSEPLYVIDGVPVVNNVDSEIPLTGGNGKLSNPLANLNPSEIETIDILKDASASAIYGVRGANGVIIITTKRGTKGAPVFSFDAYTSFQNVNTLELLKARDYTDLILEMFENAGEEIDSNNEPTNLLDPNYVVDRSDWQDAFFKSGLVQNYNLGVSGGTEKTDYFVSGGYHKNDATTIGSGFERYTLRVNSNYHLGKFQFGESLSLSRSIHRRAPFLAARSQIRTIIKHAPTIDIYNDENEGGFNGPDEGDGYGRWNTIGLAELTEHYVKRNRIIGNVYGEFEFFDGLSYRLNLGLDAVFTNGSIYRPRYYFSEGFEEPSPTLRDYNTEELSSLIENTLTFSQNFGNHNLTLLAGFTQQEYLFSRFSGFSGALLGNDLRTFNTSSRDAEIVLSGFDDEWAIRSLLGRINYSYQGKYLFTGNIRRDSSSRFSEDNRHGVFPSFSLGWVLSEENFLKDSKVVNNLKLRAGYGELGNQEIPPYGFQSTLITYANYVFGNSVATGVTQITLANQDLKWETSTQTNIGLDLAMYQNKLQLNFEYFIKETKDIILRAPLPGSLGITELPLVNAGNIENKGVELAANYRSHIGDLSLEIGANATFLENTVKSLGIGLPIEGRFPDADGSVLQVIREGETINSFIGHVTDGVFQNQAEVDAHATQANAAPGDIRFKDLDNNGVINDDDRKILGKPVPDLSYGFTASFNYKNFDISLFLQGLTGIEIYNGLRYWSEGLSEITNHTTVALDRWTGPGTSNTIPRAVLGDPNFNRRASDRFLEDGSFLRLKNIAIGYSIPQRALDRFGNGVISNFRIYFSGQNLLTFTDYSGYDPEIGIGFNQGVEVANQGVDYGIIPQPKTVLVGLQLKF